MKRALLFLSLLCAAHASQVYSVLPTGSMKPWITEHHVLIVERTPFSDLEVGDVIVYRMDKPFIYNGVPYDEVVHAVWRKSSGGRVVLCKGLANDLPDRDLVTEDKYIGKVVAIVPVEEYYRPIVARPVRFELDSGAKGDRIER